MGFKMKPVNGKLADDFHEESVTGVDAVLERMWQVSGKWPGSFAEAFDVSENTLKTWRRRGAVSTKYLQGFAQKHGATLDYLLHGDQGATGAGLVLDANERVLIEYYRAAPKELRDAALRVLLGGDAPAAPKRVGQQIGGTGHQITNKGKIVNKGRE